MSFPPDQKPGGLWLEGTYLIHPNSISKTCQKGKDNHSLFGDATATNFECLWFYFIMGEIFSLGCMFSFMFFGLVPWKWWEKSDDESAIDVVSKCGIPKGLSIGEKHIGGVLSPHISETDRSWRSGVQTQAIDGIAPMKRHIFLGWSKWVSLKIGTAIFLSRSS